MSTDDRLWCDGINHKVELDVVTFIEHPDEVHRTMVMGSLDSVKTQIRDIVSSKSPNASVFYEYCCDKCKEAAND